MYFFILQPEDDTGQLDYRYDEFGFKVEEEGWYYCSLFLGDDNDFSYKLLTNCMDM